MYRNAPSQRHHISVNGGTDKIRYEVSAAYQNQEGIILSTGQRRLNLRGNLDIQVSSKFKVGANFPIHLTGIEKWKKGVLIMDRFLGL